MESFDFYLQGKDGKFVKDRYFSTIMESCASEIDAKNHIITIKTPIGRHQLTTKNTNSIPQLVNGQKVNGNTNRYKSL